MRAAALALLLLAGCTTAPVAPTDGAADLVLVNGVVWTNDERGSFAEALAVRDGLVLATGTSAAMRALAGPGTRLVDVQGGAVLPGFRDHHAHFLEVAAGTGKVAGLGLEGSRPYEPSFDPDPDPVATELARAQLAAYHAGVKAAGKTPSDDPDDPATDCRAPAPVTEELKQRLRAMQDALAAQGVTTAVEAGLSDLGVWDALTEMERDGELRVRFLVRIAWGCIDEAAARGLRTGAGGDWARVLGVKLYSDGWLGPRTSALRAPYSDRPLYDGILFQDPASWVGAVRKAKDLGFHVSTHAIGDRAMEVMLDAYEANGASPADRWSLEHVQVLAPDLLDRMAARGVIGSMQLSFATSDMGFAESALGAERGRWAYAWHSAQERGVRLAGGSDYPVEVPTPLWGVQRTVTRQELDGSPEGGWHPAERLSLERTLQLLTSDAAFASLEDDRGRLVAGARADLVALREDIFSLPAERLAGATVVLTVVNGEVAFEGSRAYPPEGPSLFGASSRPPRSEGLQGSV